MSWTDFQEGLVIVAADGILWISILTLAASLGLAVLTLFLGFVRRTW